VHRRRGPRILRSRLPVPLTSRSLHGPTHRHGGVGRWIGVLWVANVGDSRAVLSRGRLAEQLTVDHTGFCSDERQRIQELGGFVTEKGAIFK